MSESSPDRAALVSAWTRVQKDFWAVEELDRLCRDEPETAWEMVLALLAGADDELIGMVGAGPLEDLICDHGAQLIDRIEAAAAHDVALSTALVSVWLDSSEGPLGERFLRLGCQPPP